MSMESPFLSPNRPLLAQQEGRAIHKGGRAQRARSFAWRLLNQNQRRTNAEGLPIGVVITPGQAHDVTAFPALMQEIDCDPEQMLGDKGYDSEADAGVWRCRLIHVELPALTAALVHEETDGVLIVRDPRWELILIKGRR